MVKFMYWEACITLPVLVMRSFSGFLRMCDQSVDIKNPLIICGNFNIDWLNNGTYSVKFKKIVQDSGFDQLVKQVTHPKPNKMGGSIIDLMMVNGKHALKTTVEETPRISDHYIVKVDLLVGWYKKQNVTVNTRGRIDFDRVNDSLKEIRWNYSLHIDLNDKCEIFFDSVLRVLNQIAPKKQKLIKFYYKEWFNKRVRTAIGNRDDAYRNYKADKTEDNRNMYKQCRNRVLTFIREEKKSFLSQKNW